MPGLYPHKWGDVAGVTSCLLSVVTASPSAEHTQVLLRGARAGFLRHGLLLTLPPDPGQGGGPGFGDIAFTPQIADRIRARAAHPVRAAALAMVLATGLTAQQLSRVTRGDLSADTATLQLRYPHTSQVTGTYLFPVPVFARDLLEAARLYGALGERPPDRYTPLLAEGIGSRQWLIDDTARHCGLDLGEPRQRPREEFWHTRVGCSRVADPIHPTLHTNPGEGARCLPPAGLIPSGSGKRPPTRASTRRSWPAAPGCGCTTATPCCTCWACTT